MCTYNSVFKLVAWYTGQDVAQEHTHSTS